MLDLAPDSSPDSPLATAAMVAERCRARSSDDVKKEWGQYFTSARVAAFMATLVEAPTDRRAVRVLDPGAGTGILGVAVAERLIQQGFSVHLVAVETEPVAAGHLDETLRDARRDLGERFSFDVLRTDFLELDAPALGSTPLAPFDIAIGNPPYFKMSPGEVKGGDAPNIYARFMEVTSRLLVAGGQLCFIVPRSFAAGYYFQRFRLRFHARMQLEHAHVFESRRDAFKADGVLQENLIVRYRRGDSTDGNVVISSSTGEQDLLERHEHVVPRERVLHRSDRSALLFLPTDAEDLRVMGAVRSFQHRLASYGLEVSTGPVVPFRAERDLVAYPGKEGVFPMLWLQHVHARGVTWPLGGGFRKAEHIRHDAPPKLLVANSTYVLMRRFSAKEEHRRLTAAVLRAGELPGEMIGLENHLNFIHRPGGKLDTREALALATLLNSSLMDTYFRVSSGNTQVSATELRALPLPGAEVLERIGSLAIQRPGSDVDEIVANALRTN